MIGCLHLKHELWHSVEKYRSGGIFPSDFHEQVRATVVLENLYLSNGMMIDQNR